MRDENISGEKGIRFHSSIYPRARIVECEYRGLRTPENDIGIPNLRSAILRTPQVNSVFREHGPSPFPAKQHDQAG